MSPRLRAGGFEAELIPINPAGGEIQGLPAFANYVSVALPMRSQTFPKEEP